jgi:hypothetical protein
VATAGGHATGPEREDAEPRKARFFAEQKMRPNFKKSSQWDLVRLFKTEVLELARLL